MDWLTNPRVRIAFFTLVALGLVLAVDNVIFNIILAVVLPADQRPRARTVGLGLSWELPLSCWWCRSSGGIRG